MLSGVRQYSYVLIVKRPIWYLSGTINVTVVGIIKFFKAFFSYFEVPVWREE